MSNQSKYNKEAYTPETRAITDAWVKSQCPLVYFYAPSNTGKTTQLGSVFKHAARLSLPPVLLIDADQGDSTIEEYTRDPRVCTRHAFDQEPDKQYGWMLRELVDACKGEYSAIVIEGLSSIHDAMVATARAKLEDAEGPALMRASIDPTMRTQTLIAHIRKIKQTRIARGTGVPIFPTLNTKLISIDPSDMASAKKAVPDWSDNMTNKAMRSADGFIEMTRDATGVRLLTKRDSSNTFRKVRQATAADAIQKQLNLTIPGMLACWALAIDGKSKKIRAGLDQRDQKQTSTATPAPTK